ncbi:sulfotransferase [Cellulomonas sp. DKR-3]|uniref:Sulfotransferase n=2 Tax=Cellulomonas fulva TaxID=2835530 RepID=A0ABS5TUX5_9CELL|nr:sulfotransferase [Cellulomonas fulva]
MKDSANAATRRYAVATAGDRPAPDWLIVGCKRGGTTSLFNYLVRHPGVLPMFPTMRGNKTTDYFFKEQARGDAWYRSHFHTERYRNRLARTLGYRPVSGEASPFYVWDPRIAERVRAAAPDVRAIMLVREPVRRAWSHYQERVQNGVEALSFADALEAEDERLDGELDRMREDPGYYSAAYDFYSYRSRGVYLPQIRNWHATFPREQLLVIRAEDLYGDTQATFDEVCAFLGIPSVPMATRSSFNSTWRTSDLPPQEVADELAAYYEPHNRELGEYLGRPMGW